VRIVRLCRSTRWLGPASCTREVMRVSFGLELWGFGRATPTGMARSSF
jgi:hypothetical protein